MTATTTIGALNPGAGSVSPLEEAFPPADPGIVPLGSRVLVQVKRPPDKKIITRQDGTKVELHFADESKDAEKWNTQVGVVIALGPVAFHDRTTLEPWPEGDWLVPGDFVRVAKYGGDRFEVPTFADPKARALFVIFNDLEMIAKVTGDPLQIIAYV